MSGAAPRAPHGAERSPPKAKTQYTTVAFRIIAVILWDAGKVPVCFGLTTVLESRPCTIEAIASLNSLTTLLKFV